MTDTNQPTDWDSVTLRVGDVWEYENALDRHIVRRRINEIRSDGTVCYTLINDDVAHGEYESPTASFLDRLMNRDAYLITPPQAEVERLKASVIETAKQGVDLARSLMAQLASERGARQQAERTLAMHKAQWCCKHAQAVNDDNNGICPKCERQDIRQATIDEAVAIIREWALQYPAGTWPDEAQGEKSDE